MKLEELSAELREKVLACETAEDFLALAKAEGIELSDEALEAVSGGVDFRGALEALLRGRGEEKAIFV